MLTPTSVLVALAATLAQAHAQVPAQTTVPSPPPAEHFFKPDALHQAVLSPSGRRLAISRPATTGRVGVFVVDLQGPDTRATRAILFRDGDVPSVQWVDDERLVFSATDLQAPLGEDYRQAPGLYAVRHDGEELTYLVETRGRAFFTGGERVRTLPWNHDLLHVPVPSSPSSAPGGARPGEVIVGELSFSADDLMAVTPKWLDTRTGRTRRFETGPLPCPALHWWFSAQGEARAARCVQEGRESLWWQRAAGTEGAAWIRLAEAPLHQLGLGPLWVGRGETLWVEHPGGPAGEDVVAPYDFERMAPGETRVIAPGFDFSGRLLGHPEGQSLQGVRVDAEVEQTVWFDPTLQALQARVDEALPGRVNRLQCRRCGRDDAVVLVRSFSDRDPGELLLFHPAAQGAKEGGQGRWQRVGRVRPEIEPAQMGTTRLHRIRARDGRDLPVWVTRPAGAGGARPAVVLVHGGPWVRGRHWRWEALPQFLASRGYVVIEPEFRGSAGYGREHLQAGFRQWGQAMQDDVADALLWARGEGLAGAAACIVGGSYGGYSTLMGLVRHPELYRCGSAWVAVTDPFLFLEGSWWVRDDISGRGRRYSLPQLVGDVQRDREMLRANSPLAQAARITRPLQLVWGSDDQRVPIAHGQRLLKALREAGREPEWIVYDGEAHGWRTPANQADFARRLEAFLARHLGDEAAASAAPPAPAPR